MQNQQTPPPLHPQGDIPPRPKTWLVQSILVTLFCCLPFGIVGIVYAVRVNSLYDQTLYNDAVRSSNKARKWMMFGLFAGLIYLVFLLIMMLLGYFPMNPISNEALTF